MTREKHLYFITGLKNDSYCYHYILALNKKLAQEEFEEKYPDYKVVENKIISPSKKLVKRYMEVLKND